MAKKYMVKKIYICTILNDECLTDGMNDKGHCNDCEIYKGWKAGVYGATEEDE